MRQRKRVVRKKLMRGRGFMSFLRKANAFLRKYKIISSVGSALGAVGVPYAGTIGSAAAAVGYGRRKRRGGALKLAGGALRLAGGSCCR